MPNLFVALRRYAPTPDRDATEDYLTAAFHWVLSTHPGLSAHWVNWLLKRAPAARSVDAQDAGPVRWQTQVHLTGPEGNGRVDLVGVTADGGPVFLCEHKIDAPLGEHQLETYKAAGEARWPGRCLTVLVTRSVAQHGGHARRADIRLTWAQVYEQCEKWSREPEGEGSMVTEFRGLLRSLGLGPAAPVSETALRGYLPSREVEARLQTLFEAVPPRLDPKRLRGLYEVANRNARPLAFKKTRWGRIGLETAVGSGGWKPGFFFGVMLDGRDHCVGPSNPEAGPDFVGILSVQRGSDVWTPLTQSPEFAALIDRLQAHRGDWDFHPHLRAVAKPNPWHPLHLRQPMSDLLRGTKTPEDQRKRVIKAIHELSDLWLAGGELAAWRAGWQEKPAE